MHTKLGKEWMRKRKTKEREKALKKIRKVTMLLDATCHSLLSIKESKLGRKLTREEILFSLVSD